MIVIVFKDRFGQKLGGFTCEQVQSIIMGRSLQEAAESYLNSLWIFYRTVGLNPAFVKYLETVDDYKG